MRYVGQELMDLTADPDRERPTETYTHAIKDGNVGSMVELYYHAGCVDKSTHLQALADAASVRDLEASRDAVARAEQEIIKRCRRMFGSDYHRLQRAVVVVHNCRNLPHYTLRNKRAWGTLTRR